MQHKKHVIKAIDSELDRCDGLAKELIRMEGISRIRRYGTGYYNKHLKNSDGLFSDYMRTFVYLKFMEDSLKDLRTDGL